MIFTITKVFGTIAACVLDCWVGYQYIPDGHFYSGTDATFVPKLFIFLARSFFVEDGSWIISCGIFHKGYKNNLVPMLSG